jgi:phospholipid/cholesterol/gamma-HCH transport system substrate-binding protein
VPEATRAERIQALLFVAISAAVLGVVLVLLIGLPFKTSDRTYYLNFEESVAGLMEQAPVRYKGVTCGQIQRIQVNPRNPELILVTLSLKEDTPVTASTTARIASGSILGPFYVELMNSRAQSPSLPPESEIPAGASTFSRLLSKGETIGDQIATLVEQLQDLTSPENNELLVDTITAARDALRAAEAELIASGPLLRQSLTQFGDLNQRLLQIVDAHEPTLGTILADVQATTGRLRGIATSGDIEALLHGMDKNLTRVADEILMDGQALRDWIARNDLAPQMEVAIQSVKGLMDQMKDLTRVLGSESVALLRQDLSPLLSDLRRSAEGLTRLLQTLAKQPNALIFGSTQPERTLPGNSPR